MGSLKLTLSPHEVNKRVFRADPSIALLCSFYACRIRITLLHPHPRITCYYELIVLFCQSESNWYCSLHTCTPEDYIAITDCIPTSDMLCYCRLICYATVNCIATSDDYNCALNMLLNMQNCISCCFAGLLYCLFDY